MNEIHLLLIGGVILLGFLGRILFQKTNIPSTIWLVLFGILIGTVDLISVDVLQEASGIVSAIAIIGILSDGGMRLNASDVVKHGFWGIAMMVVGFIASAAGVTILLLFFEFPLIISLLAAFIVGGTSSSVVIPLVTSVKKVSERFRTILSVESVFDTFTVLLAIIAIDAATAGTVLHFEAVTAILGDTGKVLATTLVTSLILGTIWHPIVNAIRHYEFSYSATLSFFILNYSLHEFLGLNGALAVFFSGIAFANAHRFYNSVRNITDETEEGYSHPLSKRISKTHGLISFFIRVFFFVYLGLFVQIPELKFLMIGIIATFFICLTRFGYINLFSRFGGLEFTPREKKFASILIPRGLSSAVLAIFAVSQGIPFGSEIAQITVSIIFFSILATTIGSFIIREKEDEIDQMNLHDINIDQAFD
jgi:cell volume regulation protein A